jgi:Fructose-2,6-bisphosphatase
VRLGARLTDAVDLASSADQRPFSGNKGAALTHGPETLWKAFDHQESDTPSVAAVAAPMHGRLVLLRHADRDPSETDLNAIGRARAAALPDALADLPLDAIFMTGFQRNADTAAPLAQLRALAPRVLEDNAELPRALAEAASGRNAIWIGNVGNLSHLWDAYRLPGRGPIEYGDIAVLTAENGVWQVEWRRVDP